MRNQLGVKPWDKPIEIIESVRDNRRTVVKGCVGSSKTWAAATVAFWWLHSHYPARAFTFAPTDRQIRLNLWGEMRRLYANSLVPIGGDLSPVACELKLFEDLYAVGFSTNEPDRVHGIHGPNDLFILDELQGFKQEMVDAIENTLAGGNTKVLALENPSSLSGEAYDAFHSKRKLYNCITVSAYDTPNVKEGRDVIPGMITRKQVDEWLDTYGEDSNFCRVKVFAKFPKQEDDTLIPLDWIDKAVERELEPSAKISYGVDVARFGNDRTVIYPMAGRVGYAPIVLQGNDTMETAGRVAELLRDNYGSRAFIDVIGVGAGVVDRLAEQDLDIAGINVATKPDDPVKFADRRSELWYSLREAFDPNSDAAIAIDSNPDLVGEISSVKYRVDSAGRIKIESKDDMKKRIGKSPDLADALCLALYASRSQNAATLEPRNTTRRDESGAGDNFSAGDSFLSGLIE